MTFRNVFLAWAASLVIVGCAAVGQKARSAPPETVAAQTSVDVHRAGTNSTWALVCSRERSEGNNTTLTEGIIGRKNCREVFGPNEHVDALFATVHAALESEVNCRERGFAFDHLWLFVQASGSRDIEVDSSWRFLAFSGCGQFDEQQVNRLRNIVKIIGTTGNEKPGSAKGDVLACYAHFSWESYVAITKSELVAGPCKAFVGQNTRPVNKLLETLQEPAGIYKSCRNAGVAYDNLRLFVAVERGPWYWADSTGAIAKDEQCGKLSADQMQQIDALLAPIFKPGITESMGSH